jgi:hypothetical protein
MAVPRIQRSDFSHSLVHLTRERRESDRTVSAFEVLKEILISKQIRGSGNEGFVKGSRRAVCLSEIPLSFLHQFAKPLEEEIASKGYRFYGIVLSKRAVFDIGGRPVIARARVASAG